MQDTLASRERAVSYLPSIDGLRGIAILLVLWYHAPFLFRDLPVFTHNDSSPWAALGFVGIMSLGGWVGVDLFFVISGFLITTILLHLKDWGAPSWVFWQRRGLRILPLAMLYLLVLLVLDWIGDPLKLLAQFNGWIWYAFFLGNIHIALHGWQPLAVMILWSLAIEEQFYLAWPLLVRFLSRRWLLWWSGGLIALSPVVRAFMLSIADYPATFVFTFCRLDALAAGGVMALVLDHPAWKTKAADLCKRLAPFATIIFLMTFFVPFSPSFAETRSWSFSVFGYTWLAISLAILLGASLNSQGILGAFLQARALMFLGKRCYGLYMWHVLIAGIVTAGLQPFEFGFTAHILLWLATLLIFASASWLMFEKPFLGLKKFLPYGNAPLVKSETPTEIKGPPTRAVVQPSSLS